MTKPLARQLFAAKSAYCDLECKVGDALEAAGIAYDDWFVDDYDGSIEILGCERLSAEQERALWALGFDRAWTHPGITKFKATEVFYAAPRKELQQQKQG